jgi:hypothetical protein
MDTLELLGAALGLAALAGINLYLTVFVTSLAVHQGWLTLHPQYEQLAVLGDPIIIAVSGTLFVLEFFADKVPWVDSLWDSVHTIIRPIGGAFLAIAVLGDPNPVYDVIVGLLGGGMALATHGAKAGTRLLVNASPEPFSNIGLSLAEDGLVLAGMALIYHYPTAALVVAVVAVGAIIWLAPRLLRRGRAMLWFAWRRIHHVAGARAIDHRPTLPPSLDIAMHQAAGADFTLAWAAPCVSGRSEMLRGNTFGWLLLTADPTPSLYFARNIENSPKVQAIPVEGRKAAHSRGLVCDRVVIYGLADGKKDTFQFDRSRRDAAVRLAELINSRRLETSNSPATTVVV